MDILEGNANIKPLRLSSSHRFSFNCHKDISCFTKCCRNIDILLTPFDIVRLKKRLNLTSGEFLALYTVPRLLEKTDLPIVTLKLLAEDSDEKKDEKICPFVREKEGCIVYEDRPTTCRYYPLGVASLSHKEEGPSDADDFYFFINESHCKGFEEDKSWTVGEWRKDQQSDFHDDINAVWTDLIVRKRSFPANIKLTEKSKQMFFMASYDIDQFRRFIFESSFLTLYKVDAKIVDDIESDDTELLKFATSWLKWVLFKEGDFKLDEGAKEERIKKNAK